MPLPPPEADVALSRGAPQAPPHFARRIGTASSSWTHHHLLIILPLVDTAIFSALAVPNRLLIVEVLRSGPQTVGALAERLELKQPLVSNHLKVLSQVRLVQFRPVAQQRFYELRAEPFQEINNWVSAFETLWTERLDRFEAQLQALHDNTDNPSPPKRTTNKGHSR